MYLVLASIVMGVNGLCYCVLGLCMLCPSSQRTSQVAPLYSAVFKAFFDQGQVLHSFTGSESLEGECGMSPNHDAGSLRCVRTHVELGRDLGFRLLAYLLVLAGVCRCITGLYWGCGYIYMGLWTAIAEIALICNELLREDSVQLHRGMAVLLSNMFLSLVYLSAGLPYCR